MSLSRDRGSFSGKVDVQHPVQMSNAYFLVVEQRLPRLSSGFEPFLWGAKVGGFPY